MTVLACGLQRRKTEKKRHKTHTNPKRKRTLLLGPKQPVQRHSKFSPKRARRVVRPEKDGRAKLFRHNHKAIRVNPRQSNNTASLHETCPGPVHPAAESETREHTTLTCGNCLLATCLTIHHSGSCRRAAFSALRKTDGESGMRGNSMRLLEGFCTPHSV